MEGDRNRARGRVLDRFDWSWTVWRGALHCVCSRCTDHNRSYHPSVAVGSALELASHRVVEPRPLQGVGIAVKLLVTRRFSSTLTCFSSRRSSEKFCSALMWPWASGAGPENPLFFMENFQNHENAWIFMKKQWIFMTFPELGCVPCVVHEWTCGLRCGADMQPRSCGAHFQELDSSPDLHKGVLHCF